MPAIDPPALDLTGSDIHGQGARLRSRGPVTPVLLPDGVTAWSVTGYDAARSVLADERFSKDARAHWTAYTKGEIGPDFPLVAWARMENLTTAHGEEHARQRRLIMKAFTPRRVELMRPGIETLVAELLDGLSSGAADQVVDLKADFAHPVAARVIGELIGVPPEDRLTVLGVGGGYSTGTAPSTPAEMAAAFAAVRAVLLDLIVAKRQVPGDDLATDLIAAQDGGLSMTDEEVAGVLLLLLNTGTEPAMNLIVNAAWMLLTHPGESAGVRSGTATWAEVIEETLRVEAPVASMPFRYAVSDVEVGGVRIREGDPLLVDFAAPGRDPAVHGEAERFDPSRADKRHLAFGHGVHRCLGSALARLEVEIALEALFGRFPGMELAVGADELAPQGTFVMNGRGGLPVRLR